MKPTTAQQRQIFLHDIQQKIAYSFHDFSILNQALTHRSFSAHNNERLEFLGDSILNYGITKMLFETFPSLPEGRLSPLRAALVKESTLAEIAGSLQLGRALNLGSGELKNGGYDRPSILADALEALFAAVSLDSHFNQAECCVRHLFAERIRNIDINFSAKDAKSQLQEFLQAHHFPPPQYHIAKQTGEGHLARFDVICDLGKKLAHYTCANASSRRAAEQAAAKQALMWLHNYFNK